MQHSDFKLNGDFYTGSGRWHVTDIGIRVIIALQMTDENGEYLLDNNGNPMKEDWFNGPPYAVLESVFDEYDQEGCYKELP